MVLYVAHNHPFVRPGGAEGYAYELYQGMSQSERYEPVLVARIGPGETDPPGHPGTPFSSVEGDPNQIFVLTDPAFDYFLGTYPNKSLYTEHFSRLLEAQRPDVVHFQHTQRIGYDLITLVRRILPDTAIVYTLHDYWPICHRAGQMVRAPSEALCTHASHDRCNECFPEWSPEHFHLREHFTKSHLFQVDMFLAPSKFLLERFVNWGIERERIRFEEYGRFPQTPMDTPDGSRPRTRLGFFGQISLFKGVEVLLDAMEIVAAQAPEAHLFVHSANVDLLPEGPRQLFLEKLATSGENVTVAGSYGPANVPQLMSQIDWVVVPSRWWENSPLVIQEAFMHGRPVICTGIGGMAEKVAHGVNGLHFITSDRTDLAETIRTAVQTPGLWERLRSGIPPVYSMDDHVASLTDLYDELIGVRSARRAERAAT
jgi:glycosyltransferase involved in cell wall biosynthesis